MRFYDPFATMFPSGEGAQKPPAPLQGDPMSWDFSEDPMLWARTRFGERQPREKLFPEAKPYENPLRKLANSLSLPIRFH
ncbi:MAG: hypothetical protein MRY63_03735 [Neomegalonema sp.]|nr:hypothetical protein [Neomegalonema sp.]